MRVTLPEGTSVRVPVARTMAHDPHAGHEHFNCSCGKMFHSRQELTDHARRLNHKPA